MNATLARAGALRAPQTDGRPPRAYALVLPDAGSPHLIDMDGGVRGLCGWTGRGTQHGIVPGPTETTCGPCTVLAHLAAGIQ